MKTCTKCHEQKPGSEFFADKRRSGGLQASCKNCRRIAHKNYMRRTDGHKKRYWANTQAERERHYLRKYGITIAQYDALSVAQGGKCAVCGVTPSKTMDIDHCHVSGAVRGLLCTNCNRMIGHAGDSPDRLVRAAAYLIDPPARRALEKQEAA